MTGNQYKTGRVIHYKLVEVDEVPQELANGWQVYGSPVCNSNNRIWQAMVKYEVITVEDLKTK